MQEPKKISVLYVITKASWGGAQRYVYDLTTSLPKEQFEVAVAFGQPGLLVKRLQEAGVKTCPIPTLQRDVSLGGDLSSFFDMVRLFRKLRPDVVHLNSSKAGGVGALAARLAGVPRIIFTAHGWPFQEKRGSLWRALAYMGSWLTALLSHHVIVVSKNDLRMGERLPFCKSKMHLIYNGVGPLSLASGEVIRSAFPPGVAITGTVGELVHNKNQQALIEKARQNQGMYVAIVGEGEDRAYLEALVKKYNLEERVKLFGFLPPEEVLRGFDEFALPSLKEGLPYVLLDAKAAGLPIVANRVGGVGEILDAKDMSEFSLELMVQKTSKHYLTP